VPDAAEKPFVNDLEDMIDLRRSTLHSFYRAHLSEKWVAPTQPVYTKLKAFLNRQLLAWIGSYLANRLGKRHEFLDYSRWLPENGVYPLSAGTGADAEPVRIALTGDWATGTAEANEVGLRILELAPHFTIHLGDIYYVGEEAAVLEHFLGRDASGELYEPYTPVKWPDGSCGTFALNGNHEMYARGLGYFGPLLAAIGMRSGPGGAFTGQKASFFCLENEHWRVLGLDTGYNSVGVPIVEWIPWFAPSCEFENPLLEWLRTQVRLGDASDSRGLVILTHHQYFSAFESNYEKPARQLAELLQRPVLWFWGHEHRLALYGKHRLKSGVEAFGRCVGHGGMPISLETPKRGEVPLVVYDNRKRKKVAGEAVGYNGLVSLTFDGPRLSVDYRDLTGSRLLAEEWEVSQGRLVGRGVQVLEPALSRTSRPLEDAQR
jgi:hypothetical protein